MKIKPLGSPLRAFSRCPKGTLQKLGCSWLNLRDTGSQVLHCVAPCQPWATAKGSRSSNFHLLSVDESCISMGLAVCRLLWAIAATLCHRFFPRVFSARTEPERCRTPPGLRVGAQWNEALGILNRTARNPVNKGCRLSPSLGRCRAVYYSRDQFIGGGCF